MQATDKEQTVTIPQPGDYFKAPAGRALVTAARVERTDGGGTLTRVFFRYVRGGRVSGVERNVTFTEGA